MLSNRITFHAIFTLITRAYLVLATRYEDLALSWSYENKTDKEEKNKRIRECQTIFYYPFFQPRRHFNIFFNILSNFTSNRRHFFKSNFITILVSQISKSSRSVGQAFDSYHPAGGERSTRGKRREEGDRDRRVARFGDTLSDPFTRIFIRNCER